MTLLGPSQFFSAYISVSCCSSSMSGLSPRLGQWQIIHNAFRGPIYFKMYTLFDGFLTECIVNSNNNNKAFGFHVQGSPQLSVNNITLMVRSVKKGFNWPSRQVHVGWGRRQWFTRRDGEVSGLIVNLRWHIDKHVPLELNRTILWTKTTKENCYPMCVFFFSTQYTVGPGPTISITNK